MRVLRVFPRRTKATPGDPDVRIGYPGLFDQGVDEVHISVTFTWDLQEAEVMAKAWKGYGEVKVGGPALGDPGGEFEPGKYLKYGNVITSRGCDESCWFCYVPKREGLLRELEIKEGWKVHDNNLLGCSDNHIKQVFEMLSKQKKRSEFVGGLQASRLKRWHVEGIAELKPESVFFAFDDENNYEALVRARDLFRSASWPTPGSLHRLRCYVLAGYDGDTPGLAMDRCKRVYEAGYMPFLMRYIDDSGVREASQWQKISRLFIRPSITKRVLGRSNNA